MADLFGKRMVVGDELSRDREFNESLLKKLTGGDESKARQPKAKQNKPKQNKAKQSKTKQNKTK